MLKILTYFVVLSFMAWIVVLTLGLYAHTEKINEIVGKQNWLVDNLME